MLLPSEGGSVGSTDVAGAAVVVAGSEGGNGSGGAPVVSYWCLSCYCG